MKKYILALVASSALIVTGCDERGSEADKLERQQTEKLSEAAAIAVPVPAITNFYEKRLLKEIYERRDQADLTTYAYLQGLDGRLTCLGQSIGYGVPYSTQFVNPESPNKRRGEGPNMPQAEPNGLFTPDGMSATWLQLVDDKGDIHVVYVEPTIVVSPFPLTGRAVAAGC